MRHLIYDLRCPKCGRTYKGSLLDVCPHCAGQGRGRIPRSLIQLSYVLAISALSAVAVGCSVLFANTVPLGFI